MAQTTIPDPGRPAAAPGWGPIRAVLNFFGVKGSIAFVSLLFVTFVLFWVWRYEGWRPFVSATANVLAPLLAAIAALIKDADKAAKWVLTLGAIVASAVFSWYTTSELTQALKDQTEISQLARARLDLLKDDIVNYTRLLSTDEASRVQAQAGANLRKRFKDTIARRAPFRQRDFEPSTDIIEILRKLNEESGHAHYFSGEIERILGNVDRGRQRFYAYLEAEKRRTLSGEVGAAACRNAEGFCRERTGWIFHLLANDFYQHGVKLKASERTAHEALVSFGTALRHACSAIEYFPPDGFADAAQKKPTRALEKLLSEELGRMCAAAPGN